MIYTIQKSLYHNEHIPSLVFLFYMRTTTNHEITNETIAVDIKGLMEILSCGEPTAREIGQKAQARIPISGKRVLYSVDKVKSCLLDRGKII